MRANKLNFCLTEIWRIFSPAEFIFFIHYTIRLEMIYNSWFTHWLQKGCFVQSFWDLNLYAKIYAIPKKLLRSIRKQVPREVGSQIFKSQDFFSILYHYKLTLSSWDVFHFRFFFFFVFGKLQIFSCCFPSSAADRAPRDTESWGFCCCSMSVRRAVEEEAICWTIRDAFSKESGSNTNLLHLIQKIFVFV